jgi:hypothetical protein
MATLTARLPRPRRSDGGTYPARAEAVAAARDFYWGCTGLRGCEFQRLETQDLQHGLLGTFVTADVNGRLVLIQFDNYGRCTTYPVD